MVKRPNFKLPTSHFRLDANKDCHNLHPWESEFGWSEEMRKKPLTPNHWIPYKILNSTLYHFHPLEDLTLQKYKLPY